MYKCLQTEFGFDISVNRSTFFKYTDLTHKVTDLGEGKVRISRKIEDLHELYIANVTDFTDMEGVPVASTAAELSTYLAQTMGSVKAGEGIAVDGSTVSVVSGGPSTIGGFKVGTGLQVDGEGRLSASASSEVTKVVATEAEMLALQAEPLRPYRVIRLDSNRLYFLNAGTSPAVLGNWFVGPSLETTVLSFKGRTGAVDPAFNDYNFDLIPLTDKTTAATHKFVIDDDALYIENLTTQVRKQIGFSADFDLSSVNTRLTTLEDLVSNEFSGLVKQVGDLTTTTAQIDNAINNVNTGLIARVEAIEALPNTDYSLEIAALKQKDTAQDDLINFVNQKVDSTAANTVVLDQRLQLVETKNSNQDFRLNGIDTRLNDKADLVSGKVPLSQLPDIPVGRKVNVANKAARLALPIYADLTIAYESDTGDAWGLDARANPSIEANWSKLGNSAGIGVQSFNGRTGNISSQDGDYNTNQISETLTKQFVTPEQKVDWSAKETVEGSQAKADAVQADLKTYADATFIPLSQKAANSGVAPLDDQGKVPLVHLPEVVGGGEVLSTTSEWSNVISNRVPGTWYTNTDTLDLDVYLLLSWNTWTGASYLEVQKGTTGPIYKIESNAINTTHSQVIYTTIPNGYRYKLFVAGAGRTVATWLEMKRTISSTFTPVSEKGQPNGVAPLDTAGKVPTENLLTGVSGGVPLINQDGKIDVSLLPDIYGTKVNRKWFEYTIPAQRARDVIYTNNTQYDIVLNVLSTNSTTSSQIICEVEQNGVWVKIYSSSDSASVQTRAALDAVIPAGCRYRVVSRDPEFWKEYRVESTDAVMPILPPHLPIAARVWNNVKGQRVVGSWYTNFRAGGNEMIVFIRSASSSLQSREIRASIRQAGTTETFTFQSTAIDSTGNRWLQLQLNVPQGWEYQITTSGGSTTANIEVWYEMY